ncbi:MAG: sensor histidine kinase [Sphingorhabdus sp.]
MATLHRPPDSKSTWRIIGCWLLALCSALVPQPLFAGEAIELRGGDFYVQSTANASVFIDNDGSISIADVVARPEWFKPVETRWLDFGPVNGRIWVRFPLKNTADNVGEWVINLRRQFVEELRVQKVSPDGKITTLIDLPAGHSYSDRPVDDRYIAATFTMAANERTDLYISYRSESTSWMPVTFATRDTNRSARRREEIVNWTLNGALIAMFLVAVVMGQVIGWRLALAFCAYIGFGMSFVASQEGYLLQYFSRIDPRLFYVYTPILLVGMTMSSVQFARMLFNSKKKFPKYDRGLLGYFYFSFLLGLATLFVFSAKEVIVGTFLTMPVGASLFFGLGIIARLKGLAGAMPFLIGSSFVLFTILFTAMAHTYPGTISLAATLDFGHVSLVAVSFAFAGAIVVKMLKIREKLNETLRSELVSTQEKLRLSDALRESQSKFDSVRRQADLHRAQLASTSHDFQQPLLSLRKSLAQLTRADPAASNQVNAAFDYLEQLTKNSISETSVQTGLAGSGGAATENFSANAVLDNIIAMFAGEAAEKGLSLRYRPSSSKIKADPLALMRIINNLVANAIRHTQAGGVLVACRPRKNHILVQVHDTGPGMDEETLRTSLHAFVKGDDSEGSGLGLHIVKSMCAEQGFAFTARSLPGRGSSFSVQIPRV